MLGRTAEADEERKVRGLRTNTALNNIMAGLSNFRTPQLTLDFHCSAVQLHKLTETPGTAQY